MVKTKIVSSMEKCFIDEQITDKKELKSLSVLRGESFAFQLAYTSTDKPVAMRLQMDGDIAKYLTVREVGSVYVSIAAPEDSDDNYLRKTPGLYPDLLSPLGYNGTRITAEPGILKTLWISFDPDMAKDKFIGQTQELSVSLYSEDEVTSVCKLSVTFNYHFLPKQSVKVTQWLHCDCLANYYGVEPFSSEHWKIIEKFVKVGVQNGINTAYVPLFTPPLDTAPGAERTTVQLVPIKRTSERYIFDFRQLGKYMDMCQRAGVEYFEFSHLFTQWGAKHAPKIIVSTGRGKGEKCPCFGQQTDALGDEYIRFLRSFLTGLLTYLRRRGLEDRCMFHISDEPPRECLEDYKKAREAVADLLEGFTVLDAVSDIELYKSGAVTTPVPSIDRIEPFVQEGVQPLWAYYCSAQYKNVPNRFMSMSGVRTRIMGVLMYKYNIDGFLHWGYNFYNNCGSHDAINPYIDTCGGSWVPAGDTFSVYPGQGGVALESMRIRQFYDGLQDMRALQLCEQIHGRQFTLHLIQEGVCGELTFENYPMDEEYILKLREKINAVLL